MERDQRKSKTTEDEGTPTKTHSVNAREPRHPRLSSFSLEAFHTLEIVHTVQDESGDKFPSIVCVSVIFAKFRRLPERKLQFSFYFWVIDGSEFNFRYELFDGDQPASIAFTFFGVLRTTTQKKITPAITSIPKEKSLVFIDFVLW